MKPFLEILNPKPQFWAIAGFKMKNEEIRKILGDPHYTETDSTATYGGHEDHWYLILDSGQHLGIASQIPYDVVMVHSDRPDIEEVLRELNLPEDLVSDSSRFEIYNPPFKV